MGKTQNKQPDTKQDKPLEKDLAQIEAVLHEQTAANEQLLDLLKRKRQALRQAHPDQVSAFCEQENQAVQAISELEKKRLALTAQLTLHLQPTATQPMRLLELAQQIQEPARGHLLVLRQQLKQRMEQVQYQTTIARRATESLIFHMQGLVRAVSSAITATGVYSPQGTPPEAAMAVSTFNATI